MSEKQPAKPRTKRTKTAAQPPKEKPTCHIHDKAGDWKVEGIRKNVCVNDEDFTEYEGKHYCLFHLPTKEKNIEKFEQIFRQRLEAVKKEIERIESELPEDKKEEAKREISYDFRFVWFPSYVDLTKYKFTSDAYFISATFTSNANFRSATFEEKAQIFFEETKFSRTLNFNFTKIKGYVAFKGKRNNRLFIGKDALLDLQDARIDDAKKILFHTVRLEPSWFVNTDASEFIFTDCKWYYDDGKRLNVKTELQKLKQRKFENPNALLTKTCWQLAENYEESKSFPEASVFRRIANESKRLESPWYKQPITLHWWYYIFSFYGENWRRAALWLIGILLFFGFFYESPFASFQMTEKNQTAVVIQRDIENPKPSEVYKMNNGEGFAHSLFVAALQRPEPKPADTLTKFFVIMETIFAPLQAALLALAIRRKFMR